MTGAHTLLRPTSDAVDSGYFIQYMQLGDILRRRTTKRSPHVSTSSSGAYSISLMLATDECELSMGFTNVSTVVTVGIQYTHA